MAQFTVDFFSRCLMRTVSIKVLLPTDKSYFPGQPVPEEKPFKTLYLLHGIYGSNGDWINGTRLQSWAQARNLAVVMPSGENHFYLDCEDSGELYGEFIGRELVDFTRRSFPLSRRREDTFIGGLSMGGYGALRNGLKYHDTFGGIVALSAALILEQAVNSTETPGRMPMDSRRYYRHVFGDLDTLLGSDKDYRALILSLKEQGADIPAIYMACGSEDFLIEQNRAYRDFLQEQEVPVTYEEAPGVHDWIFWDTFIHRALEWLPLDDAVEGISSGNVTEK